MSINTTWTFPILYTALTLDTLEQVVVQVLWECSGIDADSGITYVRSDLVNVDPPDPKDFTAYGNLTYDIIYGWVSALIDVKAIQADVTSQINSRLNLNVVAMTPPF